MRISTPQAYSNGLAGLQRNYSNILRTQEQISSGKRILTPADDPVASVRLFQLSDQQSSLEQYDSNVTAARNSLAQEESTLDSINTLMQRVREIAVQAGNTAIKDEDRRALASELQQHEEQLLGLMNTKDSRGDYMFSGFQGKTQPFTRQSDGSYAYQGDEGQRSLQVADAMTIAVSDNGKAIFANVPNAGRLDSSLDNSAANPGSTLSVSTPLVESELAFGNGFPAAGIEIHFDDPSDPSVYNVYEAGTTTPSLASGRMDNTETSSDAVVYKGVRVQLDGTPTGGEVISVTAPATPRTKQSILDTVANLRTLLQDSSATTTETRDGVATALTNIDNGIGSIDMARTDIGARLNTLDVTETHNEDISILNKSIQAELGEVDYPEALSRLALQSTIMDAAQQSFVKVSSLSLFDRL